jgi:multiple sugar transport system ATP-binding protein
MNLLQASIHAYLEDQILIDLGTQSLSLPWDDPRSRRLARHHQEKVIFGVRPEALEVVTHGTAGPHRGLLNGRVRHLEHLGHETLAYVDTGAHTVPLDMNATGPSEHPHHHSHPRAISRIAKATVERFRRHSVEEQKPDGDLISAHDGATGDHRYRAASLVVRVDPELGVRAGDLVTVAVDTTRIFIFDRLGYRIHTGGPMMSALSP